MSKRLLLSFLLISFIFSCKINAYTINLGLFDCKRLEPLTGNTETYAYGTVTTVYSHGNIAKHDTEIYTKVGGTHNKVSSCCGQRVKTHGEASPEEITEKQAQRKQAVGDHGEDTTNNGKSRGRKEEDNAKGRWEGGDQDAAPTTGSDLHRRSNTKDTDAGGTEPPTEVDKPKNPAPEGEDPHRRSHEVEHGEEPTGYAHACRRKAENTEVVNTEPQKPEDSAPGDLHRHKQDNTDRSRTEYTESVITKPQAETDKHKDSTPVGGTLHRHKQGGEHREGSTSYDNTRRYTAENTENTEAADTDTEVEHTELQTVTAKPEDSAPEGGELLRHKHELAKKEKIQHRREPGQEHQDECI